MSLLSQGSLYVIQGSARTCIATKRSWETLSAVWPALVQAQQSEKPSILHVLDGIVNKVFKSLETFGVKALVWYYLTQKLA